MGLKEIQGPFTVDFTPGVALLQFVDPNKLASAPNPFSLLYLSVL